MLPHQFWDMTPREFVLVLAGFLEREEMEWDRTAWLAAFLGNHWRGKNTPQYDVNVMRPHRAQAADKATQVGLDLPPPETHAERREYALAYQKAVRRLGFWQSPEADTVRGYAHTMAKERFDYDASWWAKVGVKDAEE